MLREDYPALYGANIKEPWIYAEQYPTQCDDRPMTRMRVGVHLEAYSNSNTYNSVAMETTHMYRPVYWPEFGAINRCQRAPDVGILHDPKKKSINDKF